MSVRALTALATVIALLTLASFTGAQTFPQPARQIATEKQPAVKKTLAASKVELKKEAQLLTAAKQIGTIRKIAWACQDDLIATGLIKQRTKASTDIWSLPKSLVYRTKFVAPKWITIARKCQKTFRERSVPTTSDWVTAVKLVQRIYPGTAGWLLFISRREGGHGGFVMNHQGSGAGGWLQFMASTYYAYNTRAFADARSRGFIIDERANSWSDPLGQAITGAFMRYTHLDACHWCL